MLCLLENVVTDLCEQMLQTGYEGVLNFISAAKNTGEVRNPVAIQESLMPERPIPSLDGKTNPICVYDYT